MKKYFYLSEKDNWIKFEKNNPTIICNVLYVKEEEICQAYISKHEKQFLLLIISSQEGWHYLLITKLSALLRGIVSIHNGDFNSLNCFHL